MARAKTMNGKREALARDGALNRHPEAVRDALFAENPFFDPDDLVQVRYEAQLNGRSDFGQNFERKANLLMRLTVAFF